MQRYLLEASKSNLKFLQIYALSHCFKHHVFRSINFWRLVCPMVSLPVSTGITPTSDRSSHLNEQHTSLWQNSQFSIYLGTTAFTGTATAMQQLLLSWLLVGILLLPADQVGMVQALIGPAGDCANAMGRRQCRSNRCKIVSA